MKRMLVVLGVAIVLFSASAAASFYLGRHESHHGAEEAKEVKEAKGDKGHKGVPSFAKGTVAASDIGPARPLAKANNSSTPENVAILAANLRQQTESLRLKEQSLTTRQKHLEVIYQDMRNERKALDQMREEIASELKGLTDALDKLERKAGDLNKQKQKISEQAKEIKQSIFEMEGVEQKRVKQMATMYDSMDPETAGEILQQMADSGKLDMAVKILSTMQERQAARVLAQMSDRGTVVQMLDKLKGLKRPAATP